MIPNVIRQTEQRGRGRLQNGQAVAFISRSVSGSVVFEKRKLALTLFAALARGLKARELLLSYAVVNGRLPCPARCANWPNCTTTAAETRDAAGNCTSGGIDDYYGGALAGGAMGGLLPALTIGAQNVDASGFAVDCRNLGTSVGVRCKLPILGSYRLISR